jgi:hypothetical protein
MAMVSLSGGVQVGNEKGKSRTGKLLLLLTNTAGYELVSDVDALV